MPHGLFGADVYRHKRQICTIVKWIWPAFYQWQQCVVPLTFRALAARQAPFEIIFTLKKVAENNMKAIICKIRLIFVEGLSKATWIKRKKLSLRIRSKSDIIKQIANDFISPRNASNDL